MDCHKIILQASIIASIYNVLTVAYTSKETVCDI